MDSKISLKDQIVKETIKILSEGGIETLSLREVAKKLNVTHQAPYHYFSDKAALLKEVKRQGFKQLGEVMEKASYPKSAPPFQRLKKVGEAYFDFCTNNPGLFRVMFSPTSEKNNERVPEAIAAFQILLEPINQLQKDGYLKAQNTELIALLGWTSMHGLVSLANENYPVLGGKLSIQQLSRMMVAQLHSLMGEVSGA
jgi:AcrR family transcriptional regulator